MSKCVHVVDYGVGNLYSVGRAIEKVGGQVRLAEDAATINAADRLILPGVGAFRDGMLGLGRNGLDEAVRQFASTGRPLLGICLGMQMLASESLEFGRFPGLGLIPGRTIEIPREGYDGSAHKVPYIGWTPLHPVRAGGLADTPLAGLGDEAVYLVHSFHVEPVDPADLLATYRYDGVAVTAAIQRDNVLGCQFHPEKSGPTGLGIIERFLVS